MTGAKFEKLVEIMSTLRGPNGCPWDKKQSFDSLKPMLIEEVYEVIDALDNRDFEGLSEELGDLLLHIVFQAQMAREAGRFNVDDVIDSICNKLIRRHPHVFGTESASTADEVVKNWEVIKEREKAEKGERQKESILDGIPSKLPALHEAHQISSKVARVGFDWPNIEGVFEKLEEEIRELKEVIGSGAAASVPERLEDEIGDILFVMVNVARHMKVDSESALKHANRKFKGRFRYLESELARHGRKPEDASLDEMEALWQEAKTQE